MVSMVLFTIVIDNLFFFFFVQRTLINSVSAA